ncbi:MAG: putative secreted lipase [Pseudonocardiales bacterium]|nr:putative secreted lipase [Pseudonocardiales bacterium]
MAMMEELRAAGSAARQLPGVLRRRACEGIHEVRAGNTRPPVILVHGYGGTGSVWSPLRRGLLQAGFGHLVSLDYNSFAADPRALARELESWTRRALADSGADRVHLIGHSLGGLIVRYAINRGALGPMTSTAVTIASPHRGAALARLAPGRCSRIMHPRSLDRNDLEAPPAGVRWVAYYSDTDRFVLPDSARLSDPRYRATNVQVPGSGHLTICRHPVLIRSLVEQLLLAEPVQIRPFGHHRSEYPLVSGHPIAA